ncbi:arylsulfatase B-like [Ptychodera flava]|uniref:arylsulfatase B-like n=1 Tax=Ptychodera flava TaxID=63121 RepID=UPI003969FC97
MLTPLLCLLSLPLLMTVLGSPKPHIIFILADDLGWHDVGYHGSIIETPNIDRLAADGVKLENYYVTPLCSPTRSVLMTGRYQIRMGMQHHVLLAQEPKCLPLDEVLLPEKLKQSGYATHMVGKWHLGFYKWDCVPNHRGFDTFFGFYLAGGDYFNHTRKCHGHTLSAYDLRDNDIMVAKQYNGQYSTTLFAEKSQEILQKHNPEFPLFLYLSFQAVHAPLQVPTKYSDKYVGKIDDEDRRLYAGLTTCMDEAIGKVVDTLKKTGLWDNTLIIFSTDNGGAVVQGGSNWPLRGQKGSLFEGGVRGPAFVSGPVLKESVRGTVNRELLYVGDWFPTFVHLAGGTTDGTKPLDGVNQWETISQGMSSPRKEIVHNIDHLHPRPQYLRNEPYQDPSLFDISVSASIRMGNWKLLTGDKGSGIWTAPPELRYVNTFKEHGLITLFNIRDDPEERNDLVHCRPDIVHRLLQRLHFYNNTVVLPREEKHQFDLSDPVVHDMAWTPWQ